MFGCTIAGFHEAASVPEGGADLHELERGLELLDEHVHPDRSDRQAEVPLERVEQIVPERGLFGRLDLREIEDDAAPLFTQPRMIADDVEREIDDGRAERLARRLRDVPVVEMEPARAEDARGEVELRAPVRDDLAREEIARPRVHLARDALGRRHEHVGALEGQPQVALVVERHGVHLPERVLTVEHPAIGAREERVGDVADALGGSGARPRRGPGALDPLALQIVRDHAAVEVAGAGIVHGDARAADRRVGRQEVDRLVVALPPSAPLDACAHERATSRVERRQCGDRVERGGGEHVAVLIEHARAKSEWADGIHYASARSWRCRSLSITSNR